MAWRLDGGSLEARRRGMHVARRRRIAQDVGIEKKEGRKALKQWIFLSIVMLF